MDKEKLKHLLRRLNVFPARALSIFLATWGVIEALNYWSIKPFEDNFLAFILLVFLIITIVEFSIYYLNSSSARGILVEALIEEAGLMLAEKRYGEILRRREMFSRSLWIEGKPTERIRLGEIAKEAAIRTNDIRAKTEILIDDLGWTLVSVERFAEADEYLRHGLDSAISINDCYLAAKANRHLGGIHLEAKDFATAKARMQSAEAFAKNIESEPKRNEMLAGIYYGMAVIALHEHDLETAAKYADKTEGLRLAVGDSTRYVKVFSLKGSIHEAWGQRNLAEENFLKGLEVSLNIGRRDEIIRNRLGLARIAKSRNDESKYLEHFNSAQTLLKTTPIPFKIDEKEISLIKLNQS